MRISTWVESARCHSVASGLPELVGQLCLEADEGKPLVVGGWDVIRPPGA